jgi:hypothetical protein
VRIIDDAQSSADVYGVALDAACVIILVLMTSIGCVNHAATKADDIPIRRLSLEDNFIWPFFSSLRPLNATIFRCNSSRELKVAMTKGTFRDTVGFQAL